MIHSRLSSVVRMCRPYFFPLLLFIGLISSAAVGGTRSRHFVAFSLPDDESTNTFRRLASVNEYVYMAYYNSNVNVYGDHNVNAGGLDRCHLVVDNVNPGLSILYLPRPNSFDSVRGSSETTAGSESSWCITLVALFISGKWRNSDQLGEYTGSLDLFYHRCMSLHYRWDAEPTKEYVELLHNLPTELTIEDVYLFEKWATRCPKPLYAEEKDITGRALLCNAIHAMMPLNEPSIFARHCFLNDLLGIEWTPHSKLKSESITSSDTPPTRKWGYLYMPKAAELSLSLDTAVIDFARFLARSGTDEKNLGISTFLEKHLGSLRLHYMVGTLSSRGDKRRVNFSFAVSFESDFQLDVSPFDFVSMDRRLPNCSSAILGPIEPLMHERSAYTKLEYTDFVGHGQHRSWTISITLNTALLRKLTAPGERIYIKITHMLDRTVYLDNDQLNNLFRRIDSEQLLNKIVASPVTSKGGNIATAELRTIRTPFINIEDPEIHSSPVIYFGYVALEPSSLTYDKIEIRYTLPIHARYMQMSKGLSPMFKALDVDGRLPVITSWDYDVAILGEPHLYVLNSADPSRATAPPSQISEYILFLRSISFLGRVSAAIQDPTRTMKIMKPTPQKLRWRRIYFKERPHPVKIVKLSQPDRTALPVITNRFSVIQCSIDGCDPVQIRDQQAYIAFTVPVGSYEGIAIVIGVTVIVTLIAGATSMLLVRKAVRTPRVKTRIE